MNLEVRGLSKRFGSTLAIDGVSFRAKPGRAFGLLGLNGAGKSTTIRIILNILKPDAGEVLWNDGPVASQVAARFGYLPEERGLYQQMKVIDHLVFFGRLNGLSKPDAFAQAVKWLGKFNILHYRDATVVELSKGNQQKIQFITSVLHRPDVVILDEPFSGLDPVNVMLFKSVIREIIQEGKVLLFSSHRLEQVEDICDEIGIIHKSKLVLSGSLKEILTSEKPKWIRLGADVAAVRKCAPGIAIEDNQGYLRISTKGVDANALLRRLMDEGVAITHFELIRPTLQDIFLREVGELA